MHSLLDFSLQYSCSSRLVVVRDLKNVGGIYIIVHTPSHDMIVPDAELKDRYLESHHRQNAMYKGLVRDEFGRTPL